MAEDEYIMTTVSPDHMLYTRPELTGGGSLAWRCRCICGYRSKLKFFIGIAENGGRDHVKAKTGRCPR